MQFSKHYFITITFTVLANLIIETASFEKFKDYFGDIAFKYTEDIDHMLTNSTLLGLDKFSSVVDKYCALKNILLSYDLKTYYTELFSTVILRIVKHEQEGYFKDPKPESSQTPNTPKHP
ncbi:uncharacterized protein LOC132930306 [Rhopalosiphum padi]|uniref:uncharacterized protein LOC132930306 n=1 Tax=Rhopalosiphum padi TaxID=40932 RepID=UPI00298D6F96|nr:uncharacterized protein LOC132930306 [Rhopalosiphum padi]